VRDLIDILRGFRDEADATRRRQWGTEDLPQLRERFSLWRRLRRVARDNARDARRALRATEDPKRGHVVNRVAPSLRKERSVPNGGPRNIRRSMAVWHDVKERR
jgi:hypothetical protein